MPRYTAYSPGAAPEADAQALETLSAQPGCKVIAKRPGLILLEATSKVAAHLAKRLDGWIMAPESTASQRPPSRPKARPA